MQERIWNFTGTFTRIVALQMEVAMMLDFFQDRHPPNKRVAFCEKGKERHLSEGAVILAFAIYLLGEGADTVELHPDGEHGERFPIRACLESRGFVLETAKGKTEYGGTYR